MREKSEILGQFFTKTEVVEKLVNLLLRFKTCNRQIEILEPSCGTGNFIEVLKQRGFCHIDSCEVDEAFTQRPLDFFDLSIENKYDLVIGNPPFTKYNIRESYYSPSKYQNSPCKPLQYLTKKERNKQKEKIENVFILKSLKHLRDDNSSIAFVLPISFFIKRKNISVKNEICRCFSTVIIYQNDEIWFDRNIPCCFAVFTNAEDLKHKIMLILEDGKRKEKVLDLGEIHEELIPRVVIDRNRVSAKNNKGVPLREFLDTRPSHYQKSFRENTVSASNILGKTKIPRNKESKDYQLAVVRVGNASVGRCGLINVKEDVLNDMFYVFAFNDKHNSDKRIKEEICDQINSNLEYFRNITCRVGSKSIRKEDICSFKVNLQ